MDNLLDLFSTLSLSISLELETTDKDVADLYLTREGTTFDACIQAVEGDTREDAGLDLFCPEDVTIEPNALGVLVDLKVVGVMTYNNSPIHYYIYPRSSMGLKTPLRLSNQTGIIDKGYRNTLKIIVDNLSDKPYMISKGDRLVQVCTPFLSSFKYTVAKTQGGQLAKIFESERNENGLGSSGR